MSTPNPTDSGDNIPLSGLTSSDLPRSEQEKSDGSDPCVVPTNDAGGLKASADENEKAQEYKQRVRNNQIENKRRDIQNKMSEAELESLINQNRRDASDHRLMWILRIILALLWFGIAVVWQVAIIWLAYLQVNGSAHLPDTVFIALITSTSANVFGLLVIVMKFVFPAQKTSPESTGPPSAK